MINVDDIIQLLGKDVAAWNRWRKQNPNTMIDLSGRNLCKKNLTNANLIAVNFTGADLSCVNLSHCELFGANFSKVNFFEANLAGCDLTGNNFTEAVLTKANLAGANLSYANLSGKVYLSGANLKGASLVGTILQDADLHRANLVDAHFYWANLSDADLSGADLTRATLIGTNLSGANLQNAVLISTNLNKANISNCKVYGIAAWDLKVDDETIQNNLIITRDDQSKITVDNLEVAQFVYLILNNKNIRKVLNTITSKAVLILGRFTPERKEVLDAMAQKLRDHDLLPIIFDFERSSSRDFTETIKTLAGMSLFVIVDITNPKSAPLELQAIIPDYQIPFVPIIQEGEEPFSMFSDLMKFDWLLKPVITYKSKDILVEIMKEAMIDRAWEKHKEIEIKKAQDIEMVSADDFLKKKSTNDGV